MPVTVKGVTCNSLHVSCDSDKFESGERYAGLSPLTRPESIQISLASLVHCRALRVDLQRAEDVQPRRPPDAVRVHRHLQVLEP